MPIEMKKLFLSVVLLFGALCLWAQSEIPVEGVQTEAAVADSLSARLGRLQHEYNYLSCDYEIFKLRVELGDLSNMLSSTSNRLVMNMYHGGYNRKLYESSLGEYQSCCEHFETLKKKADVVKAGIFLKGLSSEFTESERNILSLGFNVIDTSIGTVEKALQYYEAALGLYKEMR